MIKDAHKASPIPALVVNEREPALRLAALEAPAVPVIERQSPTDDQQSGNRVKFGHISSAEFRKVNGSAINENQPPEGS